MGQISSHDGQQGVKMQFQRQAKQALNLDHWRETISGAGVECYYNNALCYVVLPLGTVPKEILSSHPILSSDIT